MSDEVAIFSSEWAVLLCALGLALAAALCGYALGWIGGRAFERHRLHREAVRATFDPVRRGLVEEPKFSREAGEPMEKILRRHAKEAAR